MILCLLSWSGLLAAFLVVLVVGLILGSIVTIVGIEAERKLEEGGAS